MGPALKPPAANLGLSRSLDWTIHRAVSNLFSSVIRGGGGWRENYNVLLYGLSSPCVSQWFGLGYS